jgi:Receptor family ligand binding region
MVRSWKQTAQWMILVMGAWGGRDSLLIISNAEIVVGDDGSISEATATATATNRSRTCVNRCSVAVFVPYTFNATRGLTTLRATSLLNSTNSSFKLNNLGYGHTAAALLAMDHFNARDESMVPELAHFKGDACSIQLDTATSRIFDSGMNSHQSAELLTASILPMNADVGNEDDDDHFCRGTDNRHRRYMPCAMAGPHYDLPAQLLSTFALSLEVPLVVHRAYNSRVVNPYYSPYTSQVYPDQASFSDVLISYLQYIQRDNYIALVYDIGEASLQRQESISAKMRELSIRYKSYPYHYIRQDGMGESIRPTLQLGYVFNQIKEDGYRTIVAITEFPERELPLLAQAADDVGVNGKDHVWIFMGDLGAMSMQLIQVTPRSLKIFVGSTMLAPIEGFHIPKAANKTEDAFSRAWRTQNSSMVDRVNAAARKAVASGEPGFYQGDADYFQTIRPEAGAGFMYDAIMAVGIGACLAANQTRQQHGSDNGTSFVSGAAHLQGIRSVDFHGATGRVLLGNGYNSPGGRSPSWVTFGVINAFPGLAAVDESEWEALIPTLTQKVEYVLTVEHIASRNVSTVGCRWTYLTMFNTFRQTGNSTLYKVTALLDSQGAPVSTSGWQAVAPHVFRSGKNVPPELLRTTPDQNYLDPIVRNVGLALMGLALVASASASVWAFVNRKHIVVQKSQPYSLHLVCLGSFLTSWSIFLLSFDESYGWTTEQLDRSCMSIVWLASIGHIIAYGGM